MFEASYFGSAPQIFVRSLLIHALEACGALSMPKFLVTPDTFLSWY